MARRGDVRAVPAGSEERGAGVGALFRGQRYGGLERRRQHPLGPPGGRRARRRPSRSRRKVEPKQRAGSPRPSRSRSRRSKEPAAERPAGGPKPVAKPRPQSAAAETPSSNDKPVAKDPKPAAKSAAGDEPSFTVLRGIPAATVRNMDASLSVPTATSVRSVPVKLLWDNRTVINNHLARARGGKVSFTHIIGYALVKALRSMPEMNSSYAEKDGKPNLVTPAHVNLGLAIDQQKPDGTRQLVVPSIKGCETMDFAALLDGVRGDGPQGARQQADDGRLQRHHRQPHQRRRPRHQPPGPAADAGPGARSSASARWTTRRTGRAPPRRRSPATGSARS